MRDEAGNGGSALPKPLMEVIRASERHFASKWFADLSPLLAKILEWTVMFCIGYFGFGYGWILFLATAHYIKYREETDGAARTLVARLSALSSEHEVLGGRLDALPAWVAFPDFERVEWINNILAQVWSSVDNFATPFVVQFIQPELKSILDEMRLKDLAGMNIQKVDLGGIPARVGGMKVYSSRDANRKEIVMDAEVIFNGDAVVHFTLQGVPVEIKQIVFRGTARVTLKPILDTFPFIGGFEVSFVKPPLLDYKLGRLGTFAEVPAVSSIVKIIVEDQIGSRFVWPNRFRMLLPFESILQNTNVKKLLLRVPLGLMKVCVKRAKDLVAKDKRLGSSGTSDPYVIMSIGSQKWSFREKYVEKTLNPNFEYVTYLTFEDLGRHDMLFEVFDYDNSSSDDFMGKAALDLNQAIECQSFDKWLSLEEAKHGSINVVCKWRPVLAAEDDESRASGWHILSLLVESCSGLKTSSGKMPVVKCIASDSRGNVKFIDTKARSANPVFMESGTFQGGDIDTDCLTVNIVDAKSSDSFGAAKIPFKYLRSLPEMAFESKAWDLQGGTADDAIVVLSAKLYLLKD